MRIACVHLPQFALQCAIRIESAATHPDPGPLVVVGATGGAGQPALHAPVVTACSRAAWALGVRVGMTATTARGLSPDLKIVTADVARERDTVRAVADALLGVSPVVDLGGRVGPGGAHLAIYCEVPAKTRGTSFGERLLERLEVLGLTGRVGIADDRFTAWVAAWVGAWGPNRTDARAERAHEESGVVSVPRGGSAAFLAPRPLSLLAISSEVQHMLGALGVHTLGEFAALPAPTVSSRAARFDADYQALARGESGNNLRPYAPDASIREEVTIGHGLSMPAAVALVAERIALRLAGRARCAARLELVVGGAAGERTIVRDLAHSAGRPREAVIPIAPARAGGVLTSAEELAEAIGSALGEAAGGSAAWQLRVVVTGEALAGDVAETSESIGLPVQRAFVEVAPSPQHETTDHADAPAQVGLAALRADPTAPVEVDMLSIVLSTTGNSFGLTSPVANALAAERRDAHRRTRRGKQRRRTRSGELLAQPRLFKM